MLRPYRINMCVEVLASTQHKAEMKARDCQHALEEAVRDLVFAAWIKVEVLDRRKGDRRIPQRKFP